MDKILATIVLSFRSLKLHKLRSSLTVLGIIFGVASVITMLAVGEGASAAAQESIRNLGSNNIILDSVKKEDTQENQGNLLSYGITYEDIERIQTNIESIESVARLRQYEGEVRYRENSATAEVIACDPDFFHIQQITLRKGRSLCVVDSKNRNDVCVLDSSLAEALFPYQDPLAHKVNFDGSYYQVVGITQTPEEAKRIKDYKVYIPFSSAVANYGEVTTTISQGSFQREQVDVHQLIINLASAEHVYAAYGRIERIMNHGHKIDDYTIKVPIRLLEEAAETERLFSILLGSIAGISLLVGGIGIMNIMLATVSERTKEIGLRRAIGAKKKDIVLQFMTEAIVLSLIGGAIGVLLGITMPYLVTQLFEIETKISTVSVTVAFLISGLTGVIFGSYPAIKSANLKPIDALKDI